jgi:hypothetical protein
LNAEGELAIFERARAISTKSAKITALIKLATRQALQKIFKSASGYYEKSNLAFLNLIE